MRILGAVIAGGQSRRMSGDNKLLLKFNDEYLVQRAARRLAQQTEQVVINLNSANDAISAFGYEVIPDQHEGHQGPLAGIYAVLNWLKKHEHDIDYMMTVPADAPFFPNDIVKTLTDAIGGSDIAISYYDGFPQQLFGLWSVNCLDNLDRFLQASDSRKVMRFIKSQNWSRVDVETTEPDPFMNINTPQDWQMAQKLISKKDVL